MNKKRLYFIVLMLCTAAVSMAQVKPVGAIGFYNLENLFDTEDDPDIKDEEYLADGPNQWNTERYQNKLNNMSKVIADMANGVDILGVSEVENRRVLEDLVQSPSLLPKKYQIIHFDSPDLRGIDVALIYRQGAFTPFAVNKIPFTDPEDEKFKTRDILWVKGLYLGDTLHVAVNHWPSRRGGKEDKRLRAAQILRQTVDSVMNVYADAKIILMGDFNDDPSNKSVKKILNAKNKIDPDDSKMLFNTSASTFKKGYGTLYYRGAWNLFDQIIISQSLMEENEDKYFYIKDSFRAFGPDYMRVKKEQDKGSPLRTFSRGVYLNGYSDHFPALIYIGKK